MYLPKERSTEQPNSSCLPNHEPTASPAGISKKTFLRLCVVVALLACTTIFALFSFGNAKTALLASQQEIENLERNNRSLLDTSETLQEDTEQYADALSELEEKTQELTEKITELEQLKEQLHTQLQYISDPTDENIVDLTSVLQTTRAVVPETITFLEKVYTPYQSISGLSQQLDDLDTRLEVTTLSFANVAATTIERLSAYTDIPNGLPVEGNISTYYNPTGANGERQHNGIDIATTTVKGLSATAAGTVVLSTFASGYGHYIVIDHGNGFTSLYAHNSANLVAEGDVVKAGDVIAMAGSSGDSTGIHCHYEIRLNGILQDPMDYCD